MSRFGPMQAQGICDRCKLRMNYDEMVADENAPGVRGHDYCMDELDPYRLPARQTENSTLQYPRPDEPVVVPE